MIQPLAVAAARSGLTQALDGIGMNQQLQEGLGQIRTGLYVIAIFAVVMAVVSYLAGRKFGGSSRRKQNKIASLVWAGGFIFFVLLVMPRLFA